MECNSLSDAIYLPPSLNTNFWNVIKYVSFNYLSIVHSLSNVKFSLSKTQFVAFWFYYGLIIVDFYTWIQKTMCHGSPVDFPYINVKYKIWTVYFMNLIYKLHENCSWIVMCSIGIRRYADISNLDLLQDPLSYLLINFCYYQRSGFILWKVQPVTYSI